MNWKGWLVVGGIVVFLLAASAMALVIDWPYLTR